MYYSFKLLWFPPLGLQQTETMRAGTDADRNRQHRLEEARGSCVGANSHLDKTRKNKGCNTTQMCCFAKRNAKRFQDSCRKDKGIVFFVLFFKWYFKTTQLYHKTLWFTQSVMCTNDLMWIFICVLSLAFSGVYTQFLEHKQYTWRHWLTA